MLVLGLNHGEIGSSAAVMRDGEVVAACAEERFNRQKGTRAFPRQAVAYCLKAADAALSDCDAIAQAWNPGAHWRKFNPLISGTRRLREDNLYAIPDHLLELIGRPPIDWVATTFPEHSGMPPVYHVPHHRAHAAAAFFLSPFDEAAICTMDFRGESEAVTVSLGRGRELRPLRQQCLPHSLGMFYAAYTELLGYRPDNDEWKVMALSAYDTDADAMLRKIRSTFRLLDDGGFELDEIYYRGAHPTEPHLYSDRLVELLGGTGNASPEPDRWSLSVARAMQTAAEEIASHVLRDLHARTGCPNLAVGGGFFMNCVYNGRISERTPFRNVFVPSAPGDIGNSVGAALYLAHCLKDEPRRPGPHSPYLGPEFTDEEITAALHRRHVRFASEPVIARRIAELLADGEIVAVCNGRMELGERALGNRSILADPRRAELKDRINHSIKYREPYRPFAPACLEEEAARYFAVEPGYIGRYMEKVVPVREEFRARLPAITHVDGSSRLQTVSERDNPAFHRILVEFRRLTGLPVVLNTSLNVNGEPIALSPDDALSTFFNSGLENLAIGRFLVRKGC